MKHRTVVWSINQWYKMGSPKLQKDPYFHDKFGDGDPYIHGKYGDGVPIFTGSPNSYDTGYTKTGLIAQNKFFWLVIWANRIIFYLSFELLNVSVGHTITKIQPFKPGQSSTRSLTLSIDAPPLTVCNLTVTFGKATKLPTSVLEPL